MRTLSQKNKPDKKIYYFSVKLFSVPVQFSVQNSEVSVLALYSHFTNIALTVDRDRSSSIVAETPQLINQSWCSLTFGHAHQIHSYYSHCMTLRVQFHQRAESTSNSMGASQKTAVSLVCMTDNTVTYDFSGLPCSLPLSFFFFLDFLYNLSWQHPVTPGMYDTPGNYARHGFMQL